MRLIAPLFVVVAFLFGVSTPAGAADWAVKRAGGQALSEQAVRDWAKQPDDPARLARLSRVMGPARLRDLRPEFRARAEKEAAGYADLEAYARLLLICGDASEAATWFARAVAVRPDLSAPLAGQAQALKATGDSPGAIAAYQGALALTSKAVERRRILRALLGLVADSPERNDQEVAIRRELNQLSPRDRSLFDGLVEALARHGHPEEGARLLEARLRDSAGDRVALALRIAALHEAAGDDGAAARVLGDLRSQGKSASPERRRIVWSRSLVVARKRGELPALARELEPLPEAIERELLSHVRDELGDPEGALEAARQASRKAPHNLEVRQWIIALLERLGRHAAATAEYEALTVQAPRTFSFARELCERQFRLGPVVAARATFDRMLVRFSGDPAALSELAQLASRWSEEKRATLAWERLRRLTPGDETGIIGLGELYFQRGKREAALRTWRELGRPRAGRRIDKAEGPLRFAEVLMEHDLFEDALAAANQGLAMQPNHPRPHRTLAQILERQRKVDPAIAEWEKVLEASQGPGRAGERYEARSRILALSAREGRARLSQRVTQLEQLVREHPQDREAATFLAEAQQRSGNTAAAIATLRGIVERDRAMPLNGGQPSAASGARADAIVALARALRQTKQMDEALGLLGRLTSEFPERAKDAHLQMADLELARYNDTEALTHAEAATRLAPSDSQALTRIAELEERAGREDRALASYRRAVGKPGNPAAALGLARLLQRRGKTTEASLLLRNVLRESTEEDVISDAGHRAIDLDEYLGTLDDLERQTAMLAYSGQNDALYRRLVIDILRRLVPSLYHRPWVSVASAGARAHLGQHGLRPLLEAIAEGHQAPEPALLELLGMLGNPDATPVLLGFTNRSVIANQKGTNETARLDAASASEVQFTAALALARLHDERARGALEQLATTADASLRATAIWGLGRIGGAQSADLLLRATADVSDDVAAMACVALGRLREPRFSTTLLGIASEVARNPRVRRAAVLGLGLSGDRAATGPLLVLLDAGDRQLAWAAGAALGAAADPRAVGPLLLRALLEPTDASGKSPALAALDRFLDGVSPVDEATTIEGSRLNVELMLGALLPAAPRSPSRPLLWMGHSSEIQTTLVRELQAPQGRLRALATLNSRPDQLGLGPLIADQDLPLSEAARQALAGVGDSVREQVATLATAGDTDPETRALALQVQGKLRGVQISPLAIARVASVAGTQPWAVSGAPAIVAAAQVVRQDAGSAAAVAAAVAPLLSNPAWEVRLAAVRILRTTGDSGLGLTASARTDRNPIVRAAAEAK